MMNGKGFAISHSFGSTSLAVVEEHDDRRQVIFVRSDYEARYVDDWLDRLIEDAAALVSSIDAYLEWEDDMPKLLRNYRSSHFMAFDDEDEEDLSIHSSSFQNDLLMSLWCPYFSNSMDHVLEHLIIAWKHPENRSLFLYPDHLGDEASRAVATLAASDIPTITRVGPHLSYEFEDKDR